MGFLSRTLLGLAQKGLGIFGDKTQAIKSAVRSGSMTVDEGLEALGKSGGLFGKVLKWGGLGAGAEYLTRGNDGIVGGIANQVWTDIGKIEVEQNKTGWWHGLLKNIQELLFLVGIESEWVNEKLKTHGQKNNEATRLADDITQNGEAGTIKTVVRTIGAPVGEITGLDKTTAGIATAVIGGAVLTDTGRSLATNTAKMLPGVAKMSGGLTLSVGKSLLVKLKELRGKGKVGAIIGAVTIGGAALADFFNSPAANASEMNSKAAIFPNSQPSVPLIAPQTTEPETEATRAVLNGIGRGVSVELPALFAGAVDTIGYGLNTAWEAVAGDDGQSYKWSLYGKTENYMNGKFDKYVDDFRPDTTTESVLQFGGTLLPGLLTGGVGWAAKGGTLVNAASKAKLPVLGLGITGVFSEALTANATPTAQQGNQKLSDEYRAFFKDKFEPGQP